MRLQFYLYLRVIKLNFQTKTKSRKMRIIVPMAGIGSRLRPHTLTIPKPLTLIAGKPIVQRLVEDIVKVVDQSVEEIAFVIGPTFPADTERKLLDIAEALGVEVTFFFEGLSPKADNRSRKGNVLPHDVTEDREAAELIRAYYSIPEHQRRRLFELARVLSDVS